MLKEANPAATSHQPNGASHRNALGGAGRLSCSAHQRWNIGEARCAPGLCGGLCVNRANRSETKAAGRTLSIF